MFISKKTINGKPRHYLEQSIRMLDGNVKKISIYIKDYKNKNIEEYKEKLSRKLEETYIDYSINFYKKNNIFEESLLKKIEENKLGYKKIIKNITKNQLKDIIDRFAVNFTYESNAIEGNSLTLKDVTFVIQENKIPSGKDLREVYETLNTKEALELIFENKLRITEPDIIKLHKILVKNTGIKEGYKEFPNYLIGRNVKTTPPEKVKTEVKKLINWYNKSKNIHPLEKAAIFHGRFEKIHPFDDGNGRVGRLLANMILLKEGYPGLIIRKSQRIAYFSSLEAFDNGHETKLKRFFIEKFKNTYDKFFMVYIKYLKN
ncbi:MAG: Fic family protein [Nanoarchaeota archaeon]|nr:Fic family protein [Nanoarchaeota archaeon]